MFYNNYYYKIFVLLKCNLFLNANTNIPQNGVKKCVVLIIKMCNEKK